MMHLFRASASRLKQFAVQASEAKHSWLGWWGKKFHDLRQEYENSWAFKMAKILLSLFFLPTLTSTEWVYSESLFINGSPEHFFRISDWTPCLFVVQPVEKLRSQILAFGSPAACGPHHAHPWHLRTIIKKKLSSTSTVETGFASSGQM